jgi:hypothetical protein
VIIASVVSPRRGASGASGAKRGGKVELVTAFGGGVEAPFLLALGRGSGKRESLGRGGTEDTTFFDVIGGSGSKLVADAGSGRRSLDSTTRTEEVTGGEGAVTLSSTSGSPSRGNRGKGFRSEHVRSSFLSARGSKRVWFNVGLRQISV